MSSSVHPVDEKLPLWKLLFFGFQHVLAMYSGAVAVPLVLAQAINLDTERLIYLINADLFTCGIATLVQTLSVGPYIGSKLPIVQGCTFTAVMPMIIIANSAGGGSEGLQAVYGSAIVSGLVCFVIANYFSKLLRFFPPVVTGSVITIIGLTLMPVAVGWIAGLDPTAADFADPVYIMMAVLVLAIIMIFYRCFTGFLSHIAVLLGLILGTVIACFMGYVDFTPVAEAATLGITTPFAFGLPTFDPAACVAMTLVMLVTMAETTGDMMAITEIVEKPMSKNLLTRALRADGFSTMLGGVLNAFPYTAFAQNIGLITLTGVRSRYVVATSAVIMMLLGLCPKLAAIVSCIPPMVLGGAGLAMFGMVAASGIRSLSKVEFHDNCNMMVIAISVGVAMIPVCSPGFYSKFPVTMQLICNSSITIGSITAMLLNFLLNKPQKEETFLEES